MQILKLILNAESDDQELYAGLTDPMSIKSSSKSVESPMSVESNSEHVCPPISVESSSEPTEQPNDLVTAQDNLEKYASTKILDVAGDGNCLYNAVLCLLRVAW